MHSTLLLVAPQLALLVRYRGIFCTIHYKILDIGYIGVALLLSRWRRIRRFSLHGVGHLAGDSYPRNSCIGRHIMRSRPTLFYLIIFLPELPPIFFQLYVFVIFSKDF